MGVNDMFKFTGAGEWGNKSAQQQRDSIRRIAEPIVEIGSCFLWGVIGMIVIGILVVGVLVMQGV